MIQKCACTKCSATVRSSDYTYPFCTKCYVNPNCKGG